VTPLRAAIGVVGGLLALLFFTALLVSSSSSATGGRFVCTVDRGSATPIPARLIPIYNAAANRYRLGEDGWSYLAAINEIETDYGRNLNTSSAGAQGWMQFMPGTWATYGVDANHDGKRDPYDPEDAIHAAANYLRANDAPRNWHDALYAYNHAEWYVDEVSRQAALFRENVTCRRIGGGAGRVDPGNIDWSDTSGPWAGSKKFVDLAIRLARRRGCSPVSLKRSTQSTASGGVSDHWAGATHSFAADLGSCDLSVPLGAADLAARDIAVVFGLLQHSGAVTAIHDRYRIQLIWQTDVGGNHYDHIHIGVRNLCCSY
jgi:hypothetical protein